MNAISRRKFLKNCAIGAGAVMASQFWLDKLIAGGIPASADDILAGQFGIADEDIRRILEKALSRGGDFADVFFEYKIANSISMEEDIIKNSSESISLGIGIRVLKGRQTGYGYTSDLSQEKIDQAALTAAAIANSNAKVKVAGFESVKPPHQVYDLTAPFRDVDIDGKIGLVRKAYDAAVKYDQQVKKVSAGLTDTIQYVLIANSEGLKSYDVRPQTRLMVSSTAENGSSRNTGFDNGGGRVGMNFFKNVKTPEEIGKNASKEAIILLGAESAPAGSMPVVLSKDQSGVMIHEAVGHPLEADGNWKKTSIMWDKMNQMVADPSITIFDDATIPDYRGSLNIDDEGTPTRSVPLIEGGRLVGYLNDRLSADILKHEPNGHGRRQSFRHPPIPRMNNTVLAAGDHEPGEIIESVDKGFYAVSYQGGMVQGTGKFTFSVNLGYLIENGKITKPLKNTTLIGTNVQILKEVDMVGNDMGFFLGTCGKDGQSVPVTAGTPTLKIKNMTVGGAA